MDPRTRMTGPVSGGKCIHSRLRETFFNALILQQQQTKSQLKDWYGQEENSVPKNRK